jgi:hypothetical protein
MDKKLEMPLSIVVGGYIFSLGFYFVWCFYVFYEKLYRGDYLLVVVAVVFAITAVYFFPFLSILYIKSLQKVWTSSSLVSLITLLIFFLIPLANYEMYYKFYGKKLNLKQDETVETILNNPIATNDAANRSIKELQAKLEYERKENTDLTKQLNEIIRKTKSLEEEQKTKGDIVAQAKSNKNFSKIKINSNMVNTELDTKNQEIIFKVQIISSSTRLVKNSPQFNGLKNIWEYKDSDLYKYAVGNHKDLKSASALQSELQRKGFSGAFVVAFKNGKRIPVRKAKKLLAVSE